jgi:hypothetical protein
VLEGERVRDLVRREEKVDILALQERKKKLKVQTTLCVEGCGNSEEWWFSHFM